MFRGLRHTLLLLLLAGIALSGAVALVAQPAAWIAVIVCAGGSTLVVLLWYRLARRYLATLIGRLRRVADDIGRGHTTAKLEAHPGDDLYKLVKAINTLAERLHEANIEEKRLHEQLRRTEKLAVLGELAASVAHEINNPLDGLQNCSRILRRSWGDAGRAEQMFDLMDGGLTRIAVTVRRLLTLARENVIRPLESDVIDVLESAVVHVAGMLDVHGIRLAREYAIGEAPASVDAPLLEQVFVNLMVNAIDAMPNGGELRLGVRVEARGDESRRLVCVEVADTGGGIAADVLPHIFEPFFTTKRDGKGTGLGLPIAARIVDAHHGTLSVSPRDGGTTFTVQLPARADRRSESEALAGAAGRPAGGSA